MSKPVEQLDRVIIRFAGDSGDGMQLTGGQFTSETATLGNDLSTYPDFPAEIRAPDGSLPGVSRFQLAFAAPHIRPPRAARAASGRVRLPGALRRPRHSHARRRAERARGDEPGGAEDEHQGPAEG